MILNYDELMAIGEQLLDPFVPGDVNPASIDIHVGADALHAVGSRFDHVDLTLHTERTPFAFDPHNFMLVSTLETIKVPNDCAVELKLKSSRAREGYNHSLAFWFDPGWVGIGTMELCNLRPIWIPLFYSQPMAQIIVHRLSRAPSKLYAGKYQGAVKVEAAKP